MAAFGALGGGGAEVVVADGAVAGFAAAKGAIGVQPERAAGEYEQEQQGPEGENDDKLLGFGAQAVIRVVAKLKPPELSARSKAEVKVFSGAGNVEGGQRRARNLFE